MQCQDALHGLPENTLCKLRIQQTASQKTTEDTELSSHANGRGRSVFILIITFSFNDTRAFDEKPRAQEAKSVLVGSWRVSLTESNERNKR